MSRDTLSADSLSQATKSRAQFSGHGGSKGAAGYRVEGEGDGSFLSSSGQTEIINPREGGFPDIRIGAAWDNIQLEDTGFFGRLFKKVTKQGVDIDLGCLYELQDGKRGAIQAFGEMLGAYDAPPYMALSGDERTGDAEGHDEYILLNGQKWPEIKRLLLYVYIYDGAPHWSVIKPQIQVIIPDEEDLILSPDVHREDLGVCAIAGIENVRNGMKLTNYTEYFPGHSEMDRAFGFGLEWDEGYK